MTEEQVLEIALGVVMFTGIVLALVVDAVMRTVVKLSTPRGLAGGEP